MWKVPFNRACVIGDEYQYIREAVEAGHISGDGRFTRLCKEVFEAMFEGSRCLLTTSCTHALELSALLLRISPGDEIIVPSFTFVSSVNAFVLRGAIPVFADIRPDTLNIDATLLEGLINRKTKAIVVVHYAGVACEMNLILDIAHKYGLPVVEDNAHGLFGKYRGRLLGSFGCVAAHSFHETKNITCGEGGMLLINDAAYFERAEIIREKGTDRSRFFRGQVDKYSWVDVGSSYLPSDILSAFLYAQLQSHERIQNARKGVWEHYIRCLSAWAVEEGVTLPTVPDYCEQAYHMFYMLMPSLQHRDGIISHLKSQGILSVFHYLPLHLSKMGLLYGGKPGDCPVTESVSDRLVRLPLFNGFSVEDQYKVEQAVVSYRCRQK